MQDFHNQRKTKHNAKGDDWGATIGDDGICLSGDDSCALRSGDEGWSSCLGEDIISRSLMKVLETISTKFRKRICRLLWPLVSGLFVVWQLSRQRSCVTHRSFTSLSLNRSAVQQAWGNCHPREWCQQCPNINLHLTYVLSTSSMCSGLHDYF